jgi:argininosuccinate synthase
MHSSDAFIPKYSELVYNGFWFSPEREALQALVTETQRDVAGVARLKLQGQHHRRRLCRRPRRIGDRAASVAQ